MAADDYRYAEGALTPTGETIHQIHDELERHGAGSFLDYVAKERGLQVVGFQTGAGTFLLYVPLPDPEKFPHDQPPRTLAGTREKTRKTFKSAWEQERARLTRVVFQLIKMKLVAIQEGVTTLEKEFFADLVVWNDRGKQQTVYEWYAPQIEHIREAGGMPPLLPAAESPRLLPGALRRALEGSK